MCLPPFRGSRCDIIDQSKDDKARQGIGGVSVSGEQMYHSHS